jgi:hypothetical protein
MRCVSSFHLAKILMAASVFFASPDCALAAASEPKPLRENILILIADDVGTDKISAYRDDACRGAACTHSPRDRQHR